MTTDFCPFCGSTSIDECSDTERGVAVFKGRQFYFVFCNHCEASGPTSYDKAEARRLWLQRATEPREPAGGFSPYDEWRTGADV